MRRRSVTLLATLLLVLGPVSASSAQSDELIADGRIEIPEHGYAITFPDDWVVGRVEQLVQGFAPEDPDGFRTGCNMQFGQGFGMSAEEALGFIESESYDAFSIYGDGLVDGPHSSIVTLPIGNALRLDVELMREGTRLAVTSYTYDDGATVFELSCAGLQRPADMWLSIAETLEVLPTDSGAVEISGQGGGISEPFALAGGDYKVTFHKAQDCDDEFTYAILERSDGDFVGDGWVEQNGSVLGIEEGRHYWDVEADPGECKWTLTMEPR